MSSPSFRIALLLCIALSATQPQAWGAEPVPKPWLDVLASDVIGSKVINAVSEDLGEIEELVVDVRNGQVRYVVLSFDEAMGFGGKLFAFPMTAFQPIIGTPRLQLEVDRATLESTAGFERDRWPDFHDDYWKVQDRTGLARATQLIGGKVKDLVLNFSTHRVRAALLANGEAVPLGALASGAGSAGGTRAEPAERLAEPR